MRKWLKRGIYVGATLALVFATHVLSHGERIADYDAASPDETARREWVTEVEGPLADNVQAAKGSSEVRLRVAPAQVAALKPYQDKGYAVEFLGHKGGMNEYLLTKGDDQAYFYVNPASPETGILGVQTDSNGRLNVRLPVDEGQSVGMPEQIESLTRQTFFGRSKADRVFDDAAKYLTHIPLGNLSLPPVYFFANPDCVHCAKAWKKLKAPLAEGKIHIRLLPGGSPKAALLYDQQIDDLVRILAEGEPLNSEAIPSPQARDFAADIAAMEEDYDLGMYPTFVFRGLDGRMLLLQGYNDQLLAALGVPSAETGR